MIYQQWLWLPFGLVLGFYSCEKGSAPIEYSGQMFDPIPASHSGIDFANKVHETPGRHIGIYDYFYNGGGVATGDLNNDGLPDLVFTGNDVDDRIYINEGGLKFEDITEGSGFESSGWSTGVTLADVNNDGFLDIYICKSGPEDDPSKTRNELYINDGGDKFVESAAQYGIDDNSLSTHAVFFDMDNDGDLDLFVLNHAVRNWANELPDFLSYVEKFPQGRYKRYCNTLYQNDNGKFTDISSKAGIQQLGFGLGVSMTDLDGDGLIDIYVANDYFIPDFYYKNLGNGRFEDVSSNKLSHTSYFSMGCDAADINNDGLPDLAVMDMTPADHYRSKMLMNSMNVNQFRYMVEYLKYTPQYMVNSLSINNGLGVMSDIGQMAGVSQTDWSWAPLVADFDNDGFRDMYVTNGYLRDVKNNDWRMKVLDKMKNPEFGPDDYFTMLDSAESTPVSNIMFRNSGAYEFENATRDWNLESPSYSNGAAYADLDLDGDLDLVVNTFHESVTVLRNNANQQTGNNYLSLDLRDENGSPYMGNIKVRVESGDDVLFAETTYSRGFQSSVEPVVHFGLGETEAVNQVEFVWPDGTLGFLVSPNINSRVVVNLNELEKKPTAEPERSELFGNVSMAIRPPFYHEENDYDDFELDILLPHKMSNLGPGAAVADVNGDGLDDFYVSGALGQSSTLFMQDSEGGFRQHNRNFIDSYDWEELGAEFFDADGDGDLDLYVACGGAGRADPEEDFLQDKIFINESGDFKVKDVLPEINSSTRVVRPLDWDEDGDLDLFVGGANMPGEYPDHPRSYLLENENGRFRDVTETKATSLMHAGMVTDAIWFDWDRDSRDDLVVVGEWMPVSVWLNKEDGFAQMDNPVQDSEGWWSSIEKGDFDNDGDEDLILGNVGWNNKFHPSPEKPLHCFLSDFDENGTLDIVLSKHYRESMVPVRGRECSSSQMPFLIDSFPTFHEFASSTLDEIYGQQNLNSALHLKASTFTSLYLENSGGEYIVSPLPIEVQMSAVNDFLVRDFNEDGNLDILLAGNRIETEVETVPYDAGKGLILIGRGDGTFDIDLSVQKTGLFLPGDVRELVPISLTSDAYPGVVVAKNNARLNLIVWKDALPSVRDR